MRKSRVLLAMPLVALAAWPIGSASADDPPPPNDAFASPTMIEALPFQEVVDTTTAEAGDPEDEIAQFACDSPPPSATVWYTVTVDVTQWIGLSSAPSTYSSGFNVLVDVGGELVCVGGGPVEIFFLAEAGVEYIIQVIDDQGDGGGNGGQLDVSAVSLGEPLPEACPGIAPNDPRLPPGLNLIVGTDDAETIEGTDGDDLIFAKGGDDVVNAGAGNDVIFGCDGGDTIDAGSGDDFIIGDSADFFGNPTSDSGGDDTILGGSGMDEIRGGPGDDTIDGGNSDDVIFANQGDDDVSGGNGDDLVIGGFGDDVVDGGNGADEVIGGPGSDELLGGNGADFLLGDYPNGRPDESPHTDTCDGGRGRNEVIACEA